MTRFVAKAGRPLWWVAGLSLCLALGVLAVGLFRDDEQRVDLGRADGVAVDRTGLSAAALADLVDAVAAPGPDLTGPAGVVERNAERLRVDDLTLRYVDEDSAASATGSAGRDAWQAAVAVTWGFAGFDTEPGETEVTVRFRAEGDEARIVGFGGGDRRAPLWLTEPVRVFRTDRALVVGTRPDDRRYLLLAERAVDVVRRVEPGWRTGLVVEVPPTADGLEDALAAEDGEYDQIAALTASVDGRAAPAAPVHVFVNPEVFGPLRPQGSQVVMSHEATHVATRAATAAMPLWLVEGFADYVALRDVSIPVGISARQILDRVREEGPPDSLPTDAEFGTRETHLGATYEAAWLLCRTLVEVGGEDALVRFYDAVRAGGDPKAELERIFGTSQRELTRLWGERLQDLAG